MKKQNKVFTDPLDLLPVGDAQVIAHAPVLMGETTCNQSQQQLTSPIQYIWRQRELWVKSSPSEADSPHGPRSPEPRSSHAACSAAVLSGGFRLSFLIAFLPYRWGGGS